MKIPFVHKEIVALYPTEGKVDWACLSTRVAREQQVETGTLQFEGAIQWADVAILIAKKGWEDAQIVIRLNSLYVRHFIIQGPVVESIEEFDRWVSGQLASHLPAGAEVKDFTCRSRVLFQSEDSLRCLVGLVRKSNIENELSMLQAVGIFPDRFSGLISDLDQVVMDELAVQKYGYRFMVNEVESIYLGYEDGVLKEVQHFDGLKNEEDLLIWRQLLVGWITESHPGPEHGVLLTSGDDIVFHHLPNNQLEAMGLSSRPWYLSLAGRQVGVNGFINCAMIRGLCTDIYEFNFLEEEYVLALNNRREKKLAKQVVLASGGILAGLFALVLVLQIFFSGRLDEVEENLLLMSTQISVLDKQSKTIKLLESELQQARYFLGERTGTAGILAQLGKSIPENVWLDVFTVSKEDEQLWKVLLKGAAVNAQDIALLLGRIEQLDQVSEVELVLSESVEAGQLYKKEKIQSIDLTRFTIVVRLPKTLGLPVQSMPGVS
ncbi:MAG: PilN domain-containing protein [Rhodothermales bacterium]